VPEGRASLARPSPCDNPSAVPELPDLAVVAEAFHAALTGRSVLEAKAHLPLTVRATPAEIDALEGRVLVGLGRRGKSLILDLDPDRVVLSPMLTGRFQLASPGEPMPTKTAFSIRFGPRSSAPGGAARWTHEADWLPGDGREVELRFRDPTQMGKVYVVPEGSDRAVPGLADGEAGPDADDPTLTLDAWRRLIRPHRGELKNLLRNQAFVAGIGNAYSDEILHAAALLPFRRRSTLSDEEIGALYLATRRVLEDAKETLRVRVPPTFERQVRDFLAVHGRAGEACPRCGSRISEVAPGGIATDFCRGCQR
jgi:formamidopyrimidine-DNA glycosylase